MIPITVFLLDGAALRVAFPYDAGTKDAIKALGATPVYEQKKFRYWSLPLSALDKLIAKFGDALACEPAVFLATDAKPQAQLQAEYGIDNPAICPACGTVRRKLQGDYWEAHCRCRYVAGGAQGVDTPTVAVKPQEGANFWHSGASVDVSQATKLDKLLHDNLPAWQIAEQKQKALKGKGKKWTR